MTARTINAFESQLAIALKQASITAAVGVIQNNPSMTLEEFYAIIHPQGVTETITLGELQAALTGQPLPAAPQASAPAAAAVPVAVDDGNGAAVAPAKPRRPRKPARPPEVNCLSHIGMEIYHSSVLQFLAAMEGWIRGPVIREYCGGNKGQLNAAMRKHLIPNGFVKTSGVFNGMKYALTAKGKKRAARGVPTTPAQTQARTRTQTTRSPRISGYRDIIMDFLQQNPQWHSGDDISRACGGTISARRQAVKMLVNEGFVERNGEYTVRMKYRASQLQ